MNANKKAIELPETTSIGWTPELNATAAAASFNAKVDRMQQQGYTYNGCIDLGAGGKVLVFKRA